MDLSPFGLSPFPDTPPDLSETLPLDGARDPDESVPLAERFVHCLAQARLDRIHVRDFPEFVADGGTFVVAKCNIMNIGAVVVKRTKFSIPENTVDDYTLVRRLRTILREVSILTLPQIRGNDYIINIFGWDWNASDDESSRGVSPVLVMEYAALGSLDAFLSTGSYGASMKLLWCYQVCSALSSLHNSGVIHGDVKPENVLVCEKDGEIVVKVADFGNSLFETSSEGSYCCTQAYAAPELSHGHTLSRPALKLCDIFSFGLLVWEAILDGKHYKEGSHDWEQDDEEMSEGESVVESMGVTDDGDDGDDSLGNRATETRLRGALRACARIKAEAERSQFQAIFLQTLQEDPRLRIQSIQGLERELQRSFSYPESTSIPAVAAADLGDVLVRLHSQAPEIDMFVTDFFDSSYKPDLEARLVARLLEKEKAGDLSGEESGRNAFILFRMFSRGFGDTLIHYSDVPSAAKWLEESARRFYYPALLVGRRIFEAIERPVPAVFLESRMAVAISSDAHSSPSQSLAYVCLFREYLRHAREELSESLRAAEEAMLGGIAIGRIDVLEFNLAFNPQRPSKANFLHLACILGRIDLVKNLIDAGADVNALDTRGQSPLLLACMFGNEHLIPLILTRGGDPTLPDEVGALPLHWIFSFEDSAIAGVASLLMSGRTNSLVDQSTWRYYPIEALCLPLFGSPLQWALTVRSEPAVRVLLDIGASRDQKLPQYDDPLHTSTPLQLTCGLLQYEIVQIFLERYKADSTPLDFKALLLQLGCQDEPFSAWIMHGSESSYKAAEMTIKLLQNAGCDINKNYGDSPLETPLQLTVLGGLPEIARALLKCGADVNCQDAYGGTPLHAFFETNELGESPLHAEVLELLLQAGADINLADEYGNTPLHAGLMAEVSDPAISRILDCGADLSIRNAKGQTPLHLLCTAGDDDLTEETLAKLPISKEQLDLEDHLGRTPLAMAAKDSSTFWVNFFLAKGSKIEVGGHRTLLHYVISQGTEAYTHDPSFLDFLLSHQQLLNSINSTDGEGRTPLHEAALYASPRQVRSLLRLGANPSIMDNAGLTALEIAKRCLQNQPSFVVPDGEQGSEKIIALAEGSLSTHSPAIGDGCTRSETLYAADVRDVIDILEGVGLG